MSDHVVVSNEVLGYIALVDEFFTEHGWESALLLQARRGITEALEAAVYLPDAEHIHLTRRPDGGWDAVPMRPTRDGNRPWIDALAWVDAAEQGDDRG